MSKTRIFALAGEAKPPYRWKEFVVKFDDTFCWYCLKPVIKGTAALYSINYKLVAHMDCNWGVDK